MVKNYILGALLFAVCWSFDVEATMGMSASNALSYNNTVSGISSGGGTRTSNSGKPIVVKKTGATTHMITMSNTSPSVVETKYQTLKAGDYLKVILPSFSWSVDMGTCVGTKTITDTQISFMISGTEDSEEECQLKFYGYNPETSQMLNKILDLTVK